MINGQQKQIVEYNPCEQAVVDAQNDIDKWLWFQTGLAAGLFSNKLAQSLIQNPEINNKISFLIWLLNPTFVGFFVCIDDDE